MAVLKSYPPKVGISGATGAVQADAGALTAGIRSIGQATASVVGAVQDFKKRKSDLSTGVAEVKRKARIETFNTLASEAVQKAAQQKGADLTEDEAFRVTEDLRSELDSDLQRNIYPLIGDQAKVAKYQAIDEERNGRYGAVATHAAYTTHRVKHNLRELEIGGAELISAGNYDGALASLEELRPSIGETQYVEMKSKFRNMQASNELKRVNTSNSLLLNDVKSGRVRWDDAIEQLDERAVAAGENEFLSSGQKLAADNAIRGTQKSIEVSVKTEATRLSSDMATRAAKGEDISGQIAVNGEFISSVYGEEMIGSMLRLNTAPSLATVLTEAAERGFGKPETLKLINKTRPTLYKKIADVTGWITKGKSKTSAQNALLEISESNLPAEEKAVLMNYVIAENGPTIEERNEAIRATPRSFRALLESYNEAAVVSGDEDTYMDFMEAWSEFSEYSIDHTPEEGNKKLLEIQERVIDRAEITRTIDINRMKLTGISRDIVVGRPVAGMLAREEFISDFQSEEGREPTEAEIEALRGRVWQ
jgi:hypothetical protein